MRTLLAVIPQVPLDPASGAARATRTVCELLARSGWSVRFAATTASEQGKEFAILPLLESLEIQPAYEARDAASHLRTLGFCHRGVAYRLLDTTGYSIDEARVLFAKEMDLLVRGELDKLVPEVYVTYGSSAAEVERRAAARTAGSRVVFFLHNLAYVHPRSFWETDFVITPSRFVSEHYRSRTGLQSVPLPQCVYPGDVISPVREPLFCTFINPSPAKGLIFFLRLVEIAAVRRPDIPFLVVESRAGAQALSEAARMAGIPLDRANLHITRNSDAPSRIYAVTRLLLVPSVEPEGGGMVVVEAQLNGIPVMASDRGGLPETVGTGGLVLPVVKLPDEGAPEVEAWFEAMCRLYDDPAAFQAASRAASAFVEGYRNGEVERLYRDFFNACRL